MDTDKKKENSWKKKKVPDLRVLCYNYLFLKALFPLYFWCVFVCVCVKRIKQGYMYS